MNRWQTPEIYTVFQKSDSISKRYNSKLYGSILVIFVRNIQKNLE